MRKPFAQAILFLLFVGLGGLVVGCKASTPTAAPPPPGPIVMTAPALPETTQAEPTSTPVPPTEIPLAARVNGEGIPMTIYEKQVAQFEAAALSQGYDPATPEGEAYLRQGRQQVLDELIRQLLIQQAARQAGLTISDEEVEAALQADIKAAGGEEAFEQWLAANQMTREEYREELRRQMLANRMAEQIAAQVPTRTEQVHARHIQVATREEAEALLAQLQAGADFATLARTHSLAADAINGGDLGWFPRGLLMVPEVEEAAFSLAPGQISSVVESAWGFHIVQTLEREERDVSSEMREMLRQQAVRRWQEELWQQATIERFVEP